MKLPPEIINELSAMLGELLASRLTVILVPQRIRTNEGGCVRVAIEKNAHWYREFVAAYSSSRRRRNLAFDTRIKRANTIRTLSVLIAGRPSQSQYAPHLIRIARRFAAENRPACGRRDAFTSSAWASEAFDKACPF
ncbi:hypothetical protein OH491_17500 [Termitidicoccus mucosus]|uniref:Uncharacterized protein n=1 Tax=Termitidicoccus mucosus TaxID=1184151 RepID=A0A178IKZ4_9BACT|nr:hypothetical protein AW736_11100 [Opitutaceae bacterium TSB47]